jgi:hypothetical protein
MGIAGQGGIFGISDGSVKGPSSSHAWTVTTGPGEKDQVTRGGPVDGPLKSLTSFCTELQGQLAIRICTTLLAQTYGATGGKVIAACSNQRVLNRIAKSHYDVRLGIHKEAEA